jgi:hypothetical protein
VHLLSRFELTHSAAEIIDKNYGSGAPEEKMPIKHTSLRHRKFNRGFLYNKRSSDIKGYKVLIYKYYN